MELRHYLDIILRRKWIILFTVITIMAVTIFGTQAQSSIYQSSTTLRIAASIGGQVAYSDYIYSDRLMNTYVQIAVSQPVLVELAKRLDMAQPPVVAAEIVPNTELIKITVEDTNAKRAAVAANTLADILISQSNDLYSGGGRNSLDVLGEQLAKVQPDLDRAMREYEKIVVQTPAALEKIESSRQSLQLQQNTYATLLAQYNQAQYREEIQSSMITVVDPAVVAQSPAKPQTLLNYTLGILLGLVGGAGLAFIFENLDTTLYTTEAIESLVALNALAGIPKVDKKNINIAQPGYSQVSESFRNLAVNILAADPQAHKKALLVMSAEPKQGKTTSVYHLASALSELGKTVAVVDCDTRLPALHILFDVPNEVGLAEVLGQKIMLKDALQVTLFVGVKILTSGKFEHYPPILLGSPQMGALLDDLKQQFDYVILDTPALLAAVDMTYVLPYADSLLLIIRRGLARRESLRSIKKILAGSRFQNKPIELVINQSENKTEYNYSQYHQK
jgi:capsular exopolysaccharide synthesis family protein